MRISYGFHPLSLICLNNTINHLTQKSEWLVSISLLHCNGLKTEKRFGISSVRTKIKKKLISTLWFLAFEANNASIHTSLKCKYFYLVLRSLCSSTLFVTLLESVDRMKSSENSSLLLSWCEFSFRLISRGYATYTLCCCCCCFKVLK